LRSFAGFARDNCGQLSPMAHRCTAMKRLVTNETPWPRDRDQRFSSSGLALDNRSGQGVESWRSPTREKIITSSLVTINSVTPKTHLDLRICVFLTRQHGSRNPIHGTLMAQVLKSPQARSQWRDRRVRLAGLGHTPR
jgi:hypothetical protein